MNGVDIGDQLHAAGHHIRSVKGWKALLYDSIQLALTNAFLLSKYSAVPDAERWIDYLAFRREVYEQLQAIGGSSGQRQGDHRRVLSLGHRTLSPRRHTRTQTIQHDWIAKPQRICAHCSRVRRGTRQGLKAQRVPLGELKNDRLLKIHRSVYGCKQCGVNLCRYGECWDLFHGIKPSKDH